jgi:hypothetical protein
MYIKKIKNINIKLKKQEKYDGKLSTKYSKSQLI